MPQTDMPASLDVPVGCILTTTNTIKAALFLSFHLWSFPLPLLFHTSHHKPKFPRSACFLKTIGIIFFPQYNFPPKTNWHGPIPWPPNWPRQHNTSVTGKELPDTLLKTVHVKCSSLLGHSARIDVCCLSQRKLPCCFSVRNVLLFTSLSLVFTWTIFRGGSPQATLERHLFY